MFKALDFSNMYLAVAAFFSIGVLNGCTYCEPLLAIALVLPMLHIANRHLYLKVSTI